MDNCLHLLSCLTCGLAEQELVNRAVEDEMLLSYAVHPYVVSMYARDFHQLIVHVIQEIAVNRQRWTKLPEVGGAVHADVIITHS